MICNESDFDNVVEKLQKKFETLDSALIAALANDCSSVDELEQTLGELSAGYHNAQVNGLIEQEQPTETQPSDVQFLRQLFPEVSDTRIRMRLNACDGDVDRAVEYFLNAHALAEEDRSQQQLAISKLTAANSKRTSSPIGEYKHTSDGSRFMSTWSSSSENTLPTSEFILSRTSTPESIDISKLTDLTRCSTAELERKIRLLCKDRSIQKEGLVTAVRKGKSNPLYHSASSVYVDNSRDISDTIRRIEYELGARRSYVDSHTIDLHHTIVDVALHIVGTALDSNKYQYPLTIITGAGNHSDGGVPRIKRTVANYLKQRGIKFTEFNGSLVIGTANG